MSSSAAIKKKIGDVKAHFHEIMKMVELGGQEIIITRHGKACAKITPVKEIEEVMEFGALKGMVTFNDDTDLSQIDLSEDWEESKDEWDEDEK